MPDPLIVIPTYLRTDEDVGVLEIAVASLRHYEPDSSVLMIDDGSPLDGRKQTLEAMAEKYGLRVQFMNTNEGFARAVNIGMQEALEDGRDVILANADLEFRAPFIDLMVGQQRMDGAGVAEVVGALLVYPAPRGLIQHAGQFFSLLTRTFGHCYQFAPEDLPEAQVAAVRPVTGALQFIRHSALEEIGLYDEGFCSPGDELVLTSLHGPVPMAQLDPAEHGLVTVDHSAAGDRILRGRGGNRWGFAGGKRFEIAQHHHRGSLIVVQGRGAVARLTPGHRLKVRWTKEALAGWAVYLMRRGRDYRIGVSIMKVGAARTFGPRLRQLMEGADALWVLRICGSRVEAVLQESAWSVDFGIPQTTFVAREDQEHIKRNQEMLDEFWRARDSAKGAVKLLARCGQDVRYALVGARTGHSAYLGGAYHGFLTHASCLIDGMMRIGVDPGQGKVQIVEDALVDREEFDGIVYGIDVPPYHYYVSNGVVVHNSLGWEDVDYNVRVLREGGQCVYQPLIRAWHGESIFRGQSNKKIENWTAGSWAYFRKKWQDENFMRWVPTI